MSNNLRTRNGMPFNFVNGLKVRGMDIESLIPGIEGIPEAGSKYQFAGNGSNKAFTLPVTPYNKDAIDVYVKQLYVHPDDYALVGDTVTLTEAPPAVVAGETYNVVIKVSLTTLNGYVNANRVSFEGENLDDILEKGKPLANYSALRTYAGAATQVRITDPGIAGFFYYDASDTSSPDNGGTIIVSSNGKRWKRMYEGAINVLWFGAIPSETYDSSPHFKLAVSCVCNLAKQINNSGYFKQAPELYIPAGIYRLAQKGTLSPTKPALAGYNIRGAGKTNTIIKYDYTPAQGEVDFELLLNFSNSWNSFSTIKSIGFVGNGTNDLWTVKSQLGSPQDFVFEDVGFQYLRCAVTVRYGTANTDAAFIRFIRCDFDNISSWCFGIPDSTTSQSVIHSFTDCKLFVEPTGYGVYMKSGGSLKVNGGNWIALGNGRLFHLENVNGAGIGTGNNIFRVADTKFEWQPGATFNGTATVYPLLFNVSVAKFIFESCDFDQFAVPSGYVNTYNYVHYAFGELLFSNCDIPGSLAIYCNSSQTYQNPKIRFIGCTLRRDVASIIVIGGDTPPTIDAVSYYPSITARNSIGSQNEPRDVDINARGSNFITPILKRYVWSASPVWNFGLPTITAAGNTENVLTFKLPRYSTLKRIIIQRKYLGTSSNITLAVKNHDRSITFITDTRTPISGDASVVSNNLDYFITSETARSILIIATGDVWANGIPGFIEFEYV